MAEMHTESIRKISEILKDDAIAKLVAEFGVSEKGLKDFKDVLSKKLGELQRDDGIA